MSHPHAHAEGNALMQPLLAPGAPRTAPAMSGARPMVAAGAAANLAQPGAARCGGRAVPGGAGRVDTNESAMMRLSLIHISEPTRLALI
eukprot:3769019-Alexandrium_andersonii.AAC.1